MGGKGCGDFVAPIRELKRDAMKRMIGLVAALTAGILLLPTMAVAGTTTLKGAVKGDPNSKVVVKVATNKKGFPKYIKQFEFKNVDSECGGEMNGVLNTAIDIHPNLSFVGFNSEGPDADAYQVRGDMHRRSKKITNGKILLFHTDENGTQEDDCGTVAYKATK